jgi:hypothetical protein
MDPVKAPEMAAEVKPRVVPPRGAGMILFTENVSISEGYGRHIAR